MSNEKYSIHIGPDGLLYEKPDVQKRTIFEWFSDRYENPIDTLPYSSGKEGFIYLWGGPYSAEDVIRSEFDGCVSEEVIDEIIEELESECIEWAKKPSEDDYDRYYYDVVSANTTYHGTLTESLAAIRELASMRIIPELSNVLYKMLHVNVITAMETFLSDAFISTVLGDDSLVRAFVESNKDFAERKFTLSEIYTVYENIDDKVKKYLLDLMWHNLPKVEKLYDRTMGIPFADKIQALQKAVATRHDIVHRNGKNKHGIESDISKEDILSLIEKVIELADHIDSAYGV